MKAKKHRDNFDYKGFGRRLRHARIVLGLSEEEAAAAAGRTAETWRHYENTGRGRLTEAILQFTGKYAVKLDWLMAGDGPPPRRTALRVICSGIGTANTPAVSSSTRTASLRLVYSRSIMRVGGRD